MPAGPRPASPKRSGSFWIGGAPLWRRFANWGDGSRRRKRRARRKTIWGRASSNGRTGCNRPARGTETRRRRSIRLRPEGGLWAQRPGSKRSRWRKRWRCCAGGNARWHGRGEGGQGQSRVRLMPRARTTCRIEELYPGFAASLQQRRQRLHDEGFHVARARGVRVYAVALHEVVVGADAFEQGGDERQLIFGGEVLVQGFELRDECGTVVRRQRHAGEDDARAGALELLYHAREVGLRDGEGDAAEAVVAAEFEHDDGRLFGQRHEDAGEAVLRGVAADAEIDDAIGESAAVQVLLEEVGETLPGVEAEAVGDAVAEADDGAPRVGGGGRRSGRGGGWRRLCRGFLRLTATER